ncbi:hypothetical protein RintRC_1678 [Richelia intracellularis]|nr:hypothetical protein RintRC_3755 [Richelia intracellularis]CDN12384.1 hypothetical protein RintRC_1678 [Richelia intracellularis]
MAGDLRWYPVSGELIRQAPDAMVVFGRPNTTIGVPINNGKKIIFPYR